MPVLSATFSHREVHVSMLDPRAGTPASAAELLRRHAGADQAEALDDLLREWEKWAAELLESHLSYPILAYYRSHHHQQSWLASLTIILDVSSLVIVGVADASPRAARLAFAAARHASADLCHVLGIRPRWHVRDRLPAAELAELRELLSEAGVPLRKGPEADEGLATLRRMYEPFLAALSEELLMPLPHWLPSAGGRDAWQATLWELGEEDDRPDGHGRPEGITAARRV
jgi:hypothetical protein